MVIIINNDWYGPISFASLFKGPINVPILTGHYKPFKLGVYKTTIINVLLSDNI